MKNCRSLLLLALALPLPLCAAEPALTIYNDNFAVIREKVPLDLKAGVSTATFAGATALLEPDSVVLRDPSGRAKFQLLEQSYRNDPVTQGLLLSLYEGKTITFLVKETNKPDRELEGKIIRSGYVPRPPVNAIGDPEPASTGLNEPVIEIEGKLRFSLPGLPIFPALADEAILKPALRWQIASEAAARLDAELSYVSAGFSWKADYNLVAPEKGDQLDLVGWITMKNESGQTFTEARIKLMAGDPRKIQPPPPSGRAQNFPVAAAMEAPMEKVVTEKTFDEFHLYTLERPATLRDRESKQVEFIRAVGVQARRRYEYDGLLGQWENWRGGFFPDPSLGSESNRKVRVLLEIKNSQENHLGLPLPKGRVRFYRQDGPQLEFTGEDEIDHTPKDETLHFYTGDAFDLVGERKRLKYKTSEAEHWIDETYEIKVRNHKAEPVEMRVKEHLFRSANWQIRKPTIPFTAKDSATVEFIVPLKADEEKVLTYEVHYTW